MDGVVGKAKEVAGAVTGSDNLVEEGQLQQAESRNRKEALAEDAIADAKRAEAAQEVNQTNREVAQQKGAARAEATREEHVIERERDSEHAAAAHQAEQIATAGEQAAEHRADDLAKARIQEAERIAADATATEQDAAAEKLRLERAAAAADQQAAQLRAQTKN